MVFKLVSTKSSHAGFDASGSQGDEHQPHHGQSSDVRGGNKVSVPVCDCLSTVMLLGNSNSHVYGHVVGRAVLVGVCDVMDGAHSHDDLSQRVDDGQVNNGPVQREEEEEEERRSELNR